MQTKHTPAPTQTEVPTPTFGTNQTEHTAVETRTNYSSVPHPDGGFVFTKTVEHTVESRFVVYQKPNGLWTLRCLVTSARRDENGKALDVQHDWSPEHGPYTRRSDAFRRARSLHPGASFP